MQDIIKNATHKQYSAFADAVKVELSNKLSSHPQVQAYAAEIDNIRQMKSAFADISKPSEE